MKLRFALLLGTVTTIMASSQAVAAPEFYGRVWLGVAHSDTGIISSQKETGVELENYASFLGVKGSEKITDDLDVVYVVEYGNKGGYYDSSSLLSPRNTYLGFKNDYGFITFGRNDTAFKKTEGKTDLFNITSSDMSSLIAGNDRLGDTITYYSPTVYGLKFGATYQFADNVDSSDGNYGISLTTGDAKLKQKNYYFALAYADGLNGIDAFRAVAGTSVLGAKLNVLYQRSEATLYDNLDGDSYIASISYPINKFTLKGQYIYDDAGTGKVIKSLADLSSVSDTSSNQVTLGVDYQPAKSTTLSLMATYLDGDYTDNSGYHNFDDKTTSVAVKYLF